MLLLGFGGGVIVTAANALVSDISEEQRASTLNLLNLFFGLGGLATPFIAGNCWPAIRSRICYLTAGLTAGTPILPQPRRCRPLQESADLR